jgi:uncharacterized protein YbbK (DUF523 family)
MPTPLTPHDPGFVEALRSPTPGEPLRVLVSGCMTGLRCTWDLAPYGAAPAVRAILALPNVRPFPVCPEDLAFGTPRDLCNLHGGDGFDAWDGLARVLTESGVDWTEKLLASSGTIASRATRDRIELAILVDMSAACGSQVISDGHRLIPDRRYRRGPGVFAAALLRAGIPVVSQRDFATLERLWHRLDPTHPVDTAARDHHETDWYREYFAAG